MPEELIDTEFSLIRYALQRIVYECEGHRAKPQAEKLLERLENVKRVVLHYQDENI